VELQDLLTITFLKNIAIMDNTIDLGFCWTFLCLDRLNWNDIDQPKKATNGWDKKPCKRDWWIGQLWKLHWIWVDYCKA